MLEYLERKIDRVLSPRNFSPAKSRSEITVENPQIQSRIEEENKDWNIINTELHYSFYRSKVFSLRLISKIFRHPGDLDSHNPLARSRYFFGRVARKYSGKWKTGRGKFIPEK